MPGADGWHLGSRHAQDVHDRQEGVIWALDKIVFHRDFFGRAAAILLALAEAENESWSNNATGVFTQLFTLAQGPLAPTAARPAERFPTLFEAIDSSSKRRREIALEACKVVFEARPSPRAVRSVPFGSEHIEPWRPESRGKSSMRPPSGDLEEKATGLPDEDERERAPTNSSNKTSHSRGSSAQGHRF